METSNYKKILEEEKDKLISELSTFAIPSNQKVDDWTAVRENDPSNDNTPDEVANELEDLSEREAAETTLERQLRKVDLALKRIEDGKFGICEIGGEQIEEDRLSANPSARTCKNHLDEEDNLSN